MRRARGPALRLLLLVALCVPAVQGLFRVDWFENHETTSYLARVVETARCWDDGMLSARWFPDLAGGFGYPYLSFYAPLLFWLAAAVHAAGASVPAALKIVVTVATVLGAAGAYRLAREGMPRVPALAAAVLFTYAPYHLRDLWVRGDLAEYLALAFLPWAAWGTLRLRRRADARAAVAAGAAGAGAVLSHNITGLLTGGVMAATAVVAILTAEAPRRRVAAAAIGAGVAALALSAFFWVPALAEKKWTNLAQLQAGFFSVERHVLSLRDLLALTGPDRVFVPGRPEPLGHELRVLLLAGALGPFALLARDRSARAVAALGAVLAVGGVVLSTGAGRAAYDALPVLRWVQFPWRLMGPASLGLAVLGPAGAAALGRFLPAPAWRAACGALALAAVLGTLDLARPLAAIDVRPGLLDPAEYRRRALTMGAVEFTPIWARTREPLRFQEGVCLTGGGRMSELDRGVARWRFRVETDRDQVVVLQSFWFPGWRGTLDGRPVEVRPREGSGYVEIPCPAGTHEIAARLGLTPLRRATAWVSVLAAAAAVGLALRPRREGSGS